MLTVLLEEKPLCSILIRKVESYFQDEENRRRFEEWYSSFQFLKNLIKAAPFPIRRIQTDNGTEFTNALVSTKCDHATLFENALMEYGIEYQRIRIGTPQHNGKVERQHRLDEMRFYKHLRMFSLEDGRKQLSRYQRLSNNIIMTCLNMKSPNQVLEMYRDIM